jgi:hypothetical protein
MCLSTEEFEKKMLQKVHPKTPYNLYFILAGNFWLKFEYSL